MPQFMRKNNAFISFAVDKSVIHEYVVISSHFDGACFSVINFP